MGTRTRQLIGRLSLIAIMMILPYAGYAAAASFSEPGSCAQVYIVQGNDWLSKIAEKFFGDLAAYPAIVAATNQQHELDPSFARITHPDRLEAGWKLCIPPDP